MKKILITGGAGFIGSCLADKLMQNPNYKVVMVDNMLTGNKARLPKQESNEASNWRFIHADCNNYTDISAVMMSYHFDYVFHYAAVVGVKRTLDHPKLVLDDIQGIRNILDIAKSTNVKRVFLPLPQRYMESPMNTLKMNIQRRLTLDYPMRW